MVFNDDLPVDDPKEQFCNELESYVQMVLLAWDTRCAKAGIDSLEMYNKETYTQITDGIRQFQADHDTSHLSDVLNGLISVK